MVINDTRGRIVAATADVVVVALEKWSSDFFSAYSFCMDGGFLFGWINSE